MGRLTFNYFAMPYYANSNIYVGVQLFLDSQKKLFY